MFWRFFKSVPRYAIAVAVIVGSTAAFLFWRFTRPAPKAATAVEAAVPTPQPTSIDTAKIAANISRLLLVDNDLYDIGTGELLSKNWLKNGIPSRLFFDPERKKFLAQYERGFVRYALGGSEEATLIQRFPPVFSDDLKLAFFVRDKDIWRADVDWKELKFTGEWKVTSVEQFHEPSFAANIILGTEKTLVVRNVNQLLRVALETGAVKPVRLSLNEIGKRRSPDHKYVVGLEGGQFYCYDVDADETKMIPVGRGAINDYQWLDADRCVAIAAMKTVILYDRPKHTLTEVAALPTRCAKLGQPSPEGRFVFCAGHGTGVLVDVVKRTATQVAGGAGVAWVSKDTFAFSRQVADSELRGSWLQTVAEGERRVSPTPYLVGSDGGWIMPLKAADLVTFATQHGIMRMKPDGSELAEAIKLPRPPSRELTIEEWLIR